MTIDFIFHGFKRLCFVIEALMAKLYRLLTVEDGSNLTHGKFGTSERLEVIWTPQI